MDLGIANKKALVTGASRGLGRSIASCLAEEGAQVALVARNERRIKSFINEHDGNHIGLIYDLIPEGNPTKMVSELKDADFRIKRLAQASRAVEQPWVGRSKREALVMSKKMMLNEADLRRRDSGKWHDHLRG